MPELKEDTSLNQVTLTLKMVPAWLIGLQELREKIIENIDASAAQVQKIAETLNSSIGAISTEKYEDMNAALKGLATYMSNIDCLYSRTFLIALCSTWAYGGRSNI